MQAIRLLRMIPTIKVRPKTSNLKDLLTKKRFFETVALVASDADVPKSAEPILA